MNEQFNYILWFVQTSLNILCQKTKKLLKYLVESILFSSNWILFCKNERYNLSYISGSYSFVTDNNHQAWSHSELVGRCCVVAKGVVEECVAQGVRYRGIEGAVSATLWHHDWWRIFLRFSEPLRLRFNPLYPGLANLL